MPSHPDRVRRNYHEIYAIDTHDIQNDQQRINIVITKLEVASWCNLKELRRFIVGKVYDMVTKQYKGGK
jgi:hypothetical protein